MGRILVFGESITWGAWDLELGGWCNRLSLFLGKKERRDPTVEYWTAYNLGISGDTTDNLVKRFEFETKARATEKLAFIISIGNNDSMFIRKKKDNCVPAKKFESNLKQIIKSARKFSNKIYFVGLAPVNQAKLDPIPWHPVGAYLNKCITKYNDIVKSVCKAERVDFIDMMGTFRKLKYSEFLDEDGLHLNAAGHKIIFETVRDFLIAKKLI